jgi:hypothetical protein
MLPENTVIFVYSLNGSGYEPVTMVCSFCIMYVGIHDTLSEVFKAHEGKNDYCHQVTTQLQLINIINAGSCRYNYYIDMFCQILLWSKKQLYFEVLVDE